MSDDEFKKREKELLTRRRQVLDSMTDFYNRLPTIPNTCPKCGSIIKLPNACLAMVEFKTHNDELIDYIIELESFLSRKPKDKEVS